jgi:hypothetical protein
VALVLPRAVSDHLARQRRLTLATLGLIRREWSLMGADLDASWRRVGPRVVLLTASAQMGSATNGLAYVDDALDGKVGPEAQVRPQSLAGVASDGRPLESLLYSAVIHARSAKVESLPERLRVGGLWLDRIVQTQVADAGRDAAKVAMTVRPGVRWVRVVSPPCCQRCAVLAGESRTFSHPFQRHPGCDCQMLPQAVASPGAVWAKVGPSDVTDLTRRQKLALASSTEKDPAKALNRVVNDYQRKRGQFSGYTPPTRVDTVIDRAGQREKAMEALRAIGVVI